MADDLAPGPMTAAPVQAAPVQSAVARRRVKALTVRGLEIAPPTGGGEVLFEWVDPTTLLIDAAYQRGLTERGINLIRRIVTTWDWRRFKPPIVARTSDDDGFGGFEIIDGQHTAIAAASHPTLGKIPVMVVEAASREDRAGAFIGHNRDRLGVTATQLHHSAVAAGDPQAVAIERVCAASGTRLLAQGPGREFKPGETLAVSSISAVIRKRGEDGAIAVLKALVAAECAPISAAQIKAVEMLLFDAEYTGSITAEAITELLKHAARAVDQEAGLFAATHDVRQWKALGIVIFRKARRGRRSAD